jgi:hypothetical protein
MNTAPLWPITRWNRPRAGGDTVSRLTDIEPADSPKIVTRWLSPPNAPMLR